MPGARGRTLLTRHLNKAEYEHQRRHMMQEWADMVDAWVDGRKHTPTLYPPPMQLVAPEATV